MNYELRPLNLTEILERALRLAREHAKTLIPIQACLVLPGSIMIGVQADLVSRNQAPATTLLFLAIVMFQSVVMGPMAQAASLCVVSRATLGRNTSLKQALDFGTRRLQTLIVTAFVTEFLIFGGLFLLIVPGILAALWFTFTQQVVVLERLDTQDAFARSRQLMQGQMLNAFLLGLMLISFSLFYSLIAPDLPLPLELVLSGLATIALACFGTCVTSVFYLSSRSQAEPFGLTVLAEELGIEPPGPEDIDHP